MPEMLLKKKQQTTFFNGTFYLLTKYKTFEFAVSN